MGWAGRGTTTHPTKQPLGNPHKRGAQLPKPRPTTSHALYRHTTNHTHAGESQGARWG